MTNLLNSEKIRFRRDQAGPPMLSRVADAMYWMGRYLERSEQIARILAENELVLTDLGDLASKLRRDLWHGVLTTVTVDLIPEAQRLLELPEESLFRGIFRFMAVSEGNPNSLVNCLTRARENARSVRENISAEMWEHLNTLYWSLHGEEGRVRFDESPQEACRSVITGSALLQGLTEQTLSHGQGWLFALLGRQLERIDMTARILQTRYEVLQAAGESLEGGVRNILWMSLLRSCGSLEVYRRLNVGDMDPMRVIAFLILEPTFPRTIRHCVQHAHEAAARIRGEVRTHQADGAERILGRLNTHLEYAEPDEIQSVGITAFLTHIQSSVNQAAEAVRRSYFQY